MSGAAEYGRLTTERGVQVQDDQIFQSSAEEFAVATGSPTLPSHGILVHYDGGNPNRLRFGLMAEKVLRVEESMTHLNTIFAHAGFRDDPHVRFSFVFQSEDCSIDVKSVSWERRRDFVNVCLTPDLYYTQHRGYEDLFPDEVPDWSSRADKIFWRGATSGVPPGINRDTVQDLPRYRLCDEAKKLGDAADIRFYAVVQSTTEVEREAIVNLLRAGDKLAAPVDIHDYANHRYIVQIGGNASSWGLVQKLRLGCCVLYVEGRWNSWFEQYVEPWVHYVPVRADLIDFEEKAHWARENQTQAETIARNGRALALSLAFSQQMSEAASAMASAFGANQGTELSRLP